MRVADSDAARAPATSREASDERDESLVRRAQGGEREALVVLYRRYVNEVYGFAYHQLGNAQDAEDVTSESFLRLVSALDSFDHRASFRTWLYAIARNQLRDRWRLRGRQPILAELDDADVAAASLDEGHEDPELGDAGVDSGDRDVDRVLDTDPGDRGRDVGEGDAPADTAWSARGRQVMAALPANYRTVLTLRIAHGRSIRDVAEAMHTTPGNVKVLQHRALKRAAAVAAALESTDDDANAPRRLGPGR